MVHLFDFAHFHVNLIKYLKFQISMDLRSDNTIRNAGDTNDVSDHFEQTEDKEVCPTR